MHTLPVTNCPQKHLTRIIATGDSALWPCWDRLAGHGACSVGQKRRCQYHYPAAGRQLFVKGAIPKQKNASENQRIGSFPVSGKIHKSKLLHMPQHLWFGYNADEFDRRPKTARYHSQALTQSRPPWQNVKNSSLYNPPATELVKNNEWFFNEVLEMNNHSWRKKIPSLLFPWSRLTPESHHEGLAWNTLRFMKKWIRKNLTVAYCYIYRDG